MVAAAAAAVVVKVAATVGEMEKRLIKDQHRLTWQVWCAV